MRTIWLRLMALSTFLTLAVANVASAHVVVSPEEVPADEFEKLVVSVPTEKDIPTTGVRVEVPEGFTVLGVQPVPGWSYQFEEEAGIIKAITWSGGEIRPQEFQEFAFQARTPEEPGEFSWNAYQTYEDGSVVEWTGPPEEAEEEAEEGAEEVGPASVVEVVRSGAQADEPSAAPPESGGGFAPIAAYGGLGVGILALIVALVALLRKR
jgi:uncharacterized protein YcnI